jgi:hypothetical protein
MSFRRSCCIFFAICLPIGFSYASEGYSEGKLSEDAQIELLINATKSSLEELKSLQEKLRVFRRQEAICIQSPDDAEALYKFSKAALDLLDKIHATSLEPYFRASFLDELRALSRPAEKHAIPPITQ